MMVPINRLGTLALIMVLAFLSALNFCGSDARADNPSDLEAKLAKIRADVEHSESSILEMKSEFAALLKKRTALESSLRSLKEDDATLQQKIEELKRREGKLATEVENSVLQVRRHQVAILARVKAMYISSTVNSSNVFVPIVVGRNSKHDLERLSFYARKVRELDARLFKDASQAVSKLVQGRAALADAVKGEEDLRYKLQGKRKEVEGETAKLKRIGDELVLKQRAAQEALTLLQNEAQKLEEMVAAITSGESKDVLSEGKDTDIVEEGAGRINSAPQDRSLDKAPSDDLGIVYPSLFEPSLRVSLPVQGTVLQEFGKSKLTNFADMVRSKGIEFATQPNSEVRSVQSGKVVFVGTMPGYDQMIVVEHGGRSYSLYGRLGGVDVKVGQRIERDQRIAMTSEPDAKGRNFYLEVRRNGVPVDPSEVLAKNSLK